MILRPTRSRVIMPTAITGRDSTARYSAMRGPTAAWRAVAQGGPHQEAMAISLSDLDCSLQMTRRAMKRAPVTAVLTGRPNHVASGDEIPDRRSCGSDQNNGQPIKRQQKKPPTARAGSTLQRRRAPCMRADVADHGAQRSQMNMETQ
jgi:hypothetical protein